MSRYQRLLRPRNALALAGAAGAATTGALLYNNSGPKAPHLPMAELKRDSNNRIIPPAFPDVKSRADQLADLRRSGAGAQDEQYDLLIIGGGATGTGIALDAVTRGLKVALVERDDFSAGTSSKSTKLVHGGVRYLEKAVWNLDYSQLQLVMEALRERKSFLTIAPHLSTSLPILIPLAQWWQAPYMWVGTKMYDLLAGSQRLESSYYMGKAKSLEVCPRLNGDKMVGSLVYYDGQHNDSRMNVALGMTAALYGATVLNHVEVTGLEKGADGKITGAKVRDVLSADGKDASDFSVKAKGVINATGPFADAIEQMDDPSRKPIVAPASGVHIMLPQDICPNGMGVLDAATSDGRVVFILPWQGYTLAGTTDNACDVEENPVPAQSDIDFILKETNKLLKPTSLLTHDDVLASWSGIRPLVKDPNATNTESLVRTHLISVSPSNLLTCAGGKWTTFRQMSEEAVDEAIKTFDLKPRTSTLPDVSGAGLPGLTTTGACQTRFVRLTGAHGFTPELESQVIETHGVDADIAHHLATNYGDRTWAVLSSGPESTTRLLPRHPFVEAEVLYGIRSEAACTAVDVISRRTRLSFLDVNGALAALPRVIDLMAGELSWDKVRREQEWTEAVRFLGSMGLEKNKAPVGREQAIEVEAEDVESGAGRIAPMSPKDAM